MRTAVFSAGALLAAGFSGVFAFGGGGPFPSAAMHAAFLGSVAAFLFFAVRGAVRRGAAHLREDGGERGEE